MRVDLNLNLNELFCYMSNEGSDETYIWTFFLKLDGETVRQVKPNDLSLVSNVTVLSPPGSQGNLNATGVKAQRAIPIPPHLGTYATTLRPIWITHIGRTFAIPGQVIAVVAVNEADASPNSGMENAHQSLRTYVEQRVNEYISNLNLADVASGPDPIGAVNAQIQALIDEIKKNSRQIVKIELMAAYTFGAIWEAIDPDDNLGAATFRLDERSLLNDAGRMHQQIQGYAVDADEKGTRLYSLHGARGTVDVTAQPEDADVRQTSTVISSAVTETGEYVFTREAVCIGANQRASWTRWEQVEEESFLFTYPFLPVVWSVEGKVLPESPPNQWSEVRLWKTCEFPFFDSPVPALGFRTEDREVVIAYQMFSDGPRSGVRFRNRPADGSYYAHVQVSSSLGPPTEGAPRTALPITQRWFAFDGQSVQSAFLDAYEDCLSRAFGGKKLSKRATPKDLWGPHAKKRWLEKQVDHGEQLVRTGIIERATLDSAIRVMQRQLRLASAPTQLGRP